jgi:hypothetical protein
MAASFALGRTVITATAEELLSEIAVIAALRRHVRCDWGNLCREDKESNDEALRYGGRLLSSYDDGAGNTFWIITEADRSSTCVLLPSDY